MILLSIQEAVQEPERKNTYAGQLDESFISITQHAASYQYGKEARMVVKCIAVQKYYGILTIY